MSTITASYPLLFGVFLLTVFFCYGAVRYAFKNPTGAGAIKLKLSDFFLLGLLLTSVLLIGIFSIRIFSLFLKEGSAELVFAPTVITQLLLIAVAYIFKRFSECKFLLKFKPNSGAAKQILAFFLFSFLAMIFSGIFVNTASQIFFDELPEKQEVISIFLDIDNVYVRAMSIVSIIILAPISEEIIFRGLIYRIVKGVGLYKEKWANISFALVVSSFLFALIHLNFFVILPLFIIGAILALSYEKSGNLTVPIVVHACFNLANILILSLNESVF